MTNQVVQEKKIKPPAVAGIDLNKLVKKAQESYSKKEQGLASQLSTGSSVIRPTKDEDFVLWPENDFWQTLTHLRGLPFGYQVQVSGKPNSGKSTVAMVFMKQAQDQGTLVILWDSERKFNAGRFNSQMKGNSDNLLVINTNNILNGAKAIAHFVNAAKEENPKCKILIIWDSVGASVNSSEDKDDTEDYSSQPGISAKEVAFTVRKLNKLINKYTDPDTGENTIAALIINQTYAAIGFGVSGQIEKGGTELTYLSSLIIQLSRKQDLTRVKGGEKFVYGIVSKAKIRKNHLAQDQTEVISELDIVVSANGIQLAKDVKSHKDIEGWENNGDSDE